MDWLDGLDAYWVWFAIGLVLAGAEMVVPGVYLIWLALAALATGALVYVFDPGIALQIVNFVFLSLIIVSAARRILTETPIASTDPLLNNRMGRLVGQTGTVAVAIEHGEGRVRQGDSEWSARGPELPAGARVRITGFDGGTLIVEPLALLAGDGATAPKDAP
ncbi:NfeD family protein [Tsuneonella sp. YG55]|uniref:NfeD family protein n=1 Tax=Tsuneonella litorea TaxID=2976475 RepID=A0A9X3AM41_9SPHN|nr:NfeD family protein [Tsuneonella litorea]MCT2560043.1 NfeD family protein [Tsuneonella litorea]